ncbi:MAG TPA: hypothetical protein VFU21_04295, partial [Kofleriaceae bacterium]|nr:hypothetical protein [Kofleriaceae bacterium]
EDRKANPASGITGIGDGGAPLGALRVLYGPASDDEGADLKRLDTRWTGGDDLLAANAPVIDQLILLQGRDAPGAAQPDAPILTAHTSSSRMIARLIPVIAAAQSDADWASIDDARQALVGAAGALAAGWNALPPDPDPPASRPRESLAKELADLCAQAIRPGVGESAEEQRRLARITSAVPGSIPFAVGDDAVPTAVTALLGGLYLELARTSHPQVEVQIDGYASGDGVADPQGLSESRAAAVEAELVSRGAVDPHLIATDGHGESPGGPRAELSASPVGQPSNPLLDPARSQPIRDLADLMLDLRNDGTDSSGGQRNVYSEHAYSVAGVSIMMSNEVEVPLGAVPTSVRHCLYPLVDAGVSTVTLRNPHHKTEPDRHDNGTAARGADGAGDPGDGAPGGASSDGVFRMSLRQFLLNFATVTSGVMPKSNG